MIESAGMDAKPTKESLVDALRTILAPEIGGDVVGRGLARNVRICDGVAALDLFLPGAALNDRERLEHACRSVLLNVPGVKSVTIRVIDAGAEIRNAERAEVMPGVRHLVAVASGKGGVGKSTLAVNLATALGMDGHRVGLLDADVYGPSVPTMMGVQSSPLAESGKLVPLERHGVRLMSLGFLMPDDSKHVIWRGPMVGNAVCQMLKDSLWGPLDFLLVDLPPGTGDAQLSLAQAVPLSGVVVVMTSQDVAVKIAAKAAGMFERLNVPVLGIVGNMDSFACPKCGEVTHIFTREGSRDAARRLGLTYLGSVPLDPAMVRFGDAGTPVVLAAPDSPAAVAIRAVARQVAVMLEGGPTGEDAGFGGLSAAFTGAPA